MLQPAIIYLYGMVFGICVSTYMCVSIDNKTIMLLYFLFMGFLPSPLPAIVASFRVIINVSYAYATFS